MQLVILVKTVPLAVTPRFFLYDNVATMSMRLLMNAQTNSRAKGCWVPHYHGIL